MWPTELYSCVITFALLQNSLFQENRNYEWQSCQKMYQF